MASFTLSGRLAQARVLGEHMQEIDGIRKQLRAARKAKNNQEAKRLRRELKALEDEGRRSMMTMDNKMMQPKAKKDDLRWKGFKANLVLASELRSPVPPGHFLRRFGQSDREVIDNASSEATVPQILNMMNGPVYSQLMKRQSVLTRHVNEANDKREKVSVIFLSILNRRPTVDEVKVAFQEIKGHPKEQPSKGYENIVWALMNTREFMFIQ